MAQIPRASCGCCPISSRMMITRAVFVHVTPGRRPRAKGIGKSFAASHEAMLRRNAFYVEVEKDDKNIETSSQWLQFLYDSGPSRIGRLPILCNCVVNGQLPTIVVDVHSGANVDARAFMGALKVLHHDKKLINVILTATEGMKFSQTNDQRWVLVPVREIGVQPARRFLDLKSNLTTEEKAVVLECLSPVSPLR